MIGDNLNIINNWEIYFEKQNPITRLILRSFELFYLFKSRTYCLKVRYFLFLNLSATLNLKRKLFNMENIKIKN